MSAWVAVGGDRKYRPWKKWSQGDILTGVYTESYKDNYGNNGYIIKVDSTDFEDQNENLAEGTMFGANHAGGFSSKMESIPVGSFVQVEYVEMITLEKGAYKGKPCHQVNVAIDPTRGVVENSESGNTVEVDF